MNPSYLQETEQAIHKLLTEKTSEAIYNAWFKELRLVEIKENKAFFSIYSDYKKNIIEANYMQTLTDATKQIAGTGMDTVIAVENRNS